MERELHLKEGQKKPTKMQREAGELIAFAEATPSFSYSDAEYRWDWDRNYFFRVVREARLQLGYDDEYNLVCEPQGMRELWQYRLVGTYDEAREWNVNRQEDTITRLETILAVNTAIVRGSGRSLEGRRARKIVNTVGYLLGELAEIEA